LAGCRRDRRYVRGLSHRSAEPLFQRFPRWMWRNTDVDIYNMSASIAAMLQYLDKVDPDAALWLPDALAAGPVNLMADSLELKKGRLRWQVAQV
jgi:erythromycin esterase-like protein